MGFFNIFYRIIIETDEVRDMKKENMVGFRVSLYECDNPQKLWRVIKPKNCINSKWIPQTLYEKIWMWFEFANAEDKQNYIEWIRNCDVYCSNSLHGNEKYYPKNMFMCLSQEKIDHWVG